MDPCTGRAVGRASLNRRRASRQTRRKPATQSHGAVAHQLRQARQAAERLTGGRTTMRLPNDRLRVFARLGTGILLAVACSPVDNATGPVVRGPATSNLAP